MRGQDGRMRQKWKVFGNTLVNVCMIGESKQAIRWGLVGVLLPNRRALQKFVLNIALLVQVYFLFIFVSHIGCAVGLELDIQANGMAGEVQTVSL